MPEPEWYHSTPDGPRGPLTTGQLLARLRAGSLPPDVMVWCEGWAEWRPANAVPELEPTLQRPPSAPRRPSAVARAGWVLVHAWTLVNLVLVAVVILTATGRLR